MSGFVGSVSSKYKSCHESCEFELFWCHTSLNIWYAALLQQRSTFKSDSLNQNIPSPEMLGLTPSRISVLRWTTTAQMLNNASEKQWSHLKVHSASTQERTYSALKGSNIHSGPFLSCIHNSRPCTKLQTPITQRAGGGVCTEQQWRVYLLW